MRPHRKGSKAIEFALILPVIIALLGGVMDYGWFFSQQISMTTAVRDAARAGSTTPQDEAPLEVAEDSLARAATAAGFTGTLQTNVSFVGEAPDQAIQVVASIPYDSLTGVVPVPQLVGAQIVMRMEDQPE